MILVLDIITIVGGIVTIVCAFNMRAMAKVTIRTLQKLLVSKLSLTGTEK